MQTIARASLVKTLLVVTAIAWGGFMANAASAHGGGRGQSGVSISISNYPGFPYSVGHYRHYQPVYVYGWQPYRHPRYHGHWMHHHDYYRLHRPSYPWTWPSGVSFSFAYRDCD